MKILGISDTIDSLVYSSVAPELYKDVSLVLSSGDLPLKYYDYIATVLNKDVGWVYGNHNLEDYERMMRKESTSMALLTDYSKGNKMQLTPHFGGLFVDGKVLYDKRHNLIICGLGGSMLYNGGKSQYTERQMKARIFWLSGRLKYMKRKYGRYCDILLTHAPPLGLGDGEDLCHKGFGCFLDFMDKYKPKYLLHGHIHLVDLNSNRIELYNETKVINIYKNYIIDDPTLGGENG